MAVGVALQTSLHQQTSSSHFLLCTVHQMLNYNLGYHLYKLQIVQELKETNFPQQKDFCEQFLYLQLLEDRELARLLLQYHPHIPILGKRMRSFAVHSAFIWYMCTRLNRLKKNFNTVFSFVSNLIQNYHNFFQTLQKIWKFGILFSS